MLLFKLLSLSLLSALVAAAPSSGHTSCSTNAECVQRRLPLLPPTRRRPGALRPRASPLPPTPNTFAYAGAVVQTFNPQSDGVYTITVNGASGGPAQDVVGGFAVRATADVFLTAGSSISVVVGGQGATGNYGDIHGGGGGGGSFVYIAAAPSDPIIAAGGGGGAGYNASPGQAASTTTAGTTGSGPAPGAGGQGGQGGGAGKGSASNGAGGAGWLSNGANPTSADLGNGSGFGGKSGPTFAGGAGDGRTDGSNPGGFGGGGGGGFQGGGGGGGYSGGGGGDGTNAYSGGGGGSFIIPTYNGQSTQNALVTVLTAAGDGSVTFNKK